MTILEMYEKEGSPAHLYGVGNPVFKNIFFYGGIHMSYFFAYRDFCESRVGSEGVTGLKTRGRPPRLDDKVLAGT
jgi:hypothetical protein